MPAPSEGARLRPQKTLYGRRKGPKPSAHQAALVETLLPRLKLQLRKGAEPKSYFDLPLDEVWLEIGFGAGEHLVWQAEHHQKTGIIGAEPYESGVAKLLSKLRATPSRPSGSTPRIKCGAGSPPLAVRSREREQDNVSCDPPVQKATGDLLSRIRIHTGDAREIIEALPDASLGRVFLLFPDPWPKKRHHKRRFIQMETLDALARVMKPGAELRFASDDPAYVAWVLEHVNAHDTFIWPVQRTRDWLLRPEDWPATRYEQKALHGTPAFLCFQRKEKSSPGLQSGTFKRK